MTVEVLPSIADLLLERRRSGSRPGARADGRCIALAVEGGGMRAVVSGGMLTALEQLGLRDGFDAVYGASAGAVGGAYFISGQARRGVAVFYDEINNDRFIRLRRMLQGRPVVSLDFALDEVCARHLDVGRVLGADLPLRVVLSSLREHRAVVLDDFRDCRELFEALRATMRIPFFAGPPVEVRGERYVDAAIYESIPVRSAIAGGATDVVVLLTRPHGSLRRPPGIVDRLLVAPHLARIERRLARDYLRRWQAYGNEIASLDHAGPARLLPVQLAAGTRLIAGFETSRSRLLAGAVGGYRLVFSLFEQACENEPC